MDHSRPCFSPITEVGDGSILASKFSGCAYLAPNETWPKCGRCGKPMQLFVQLNDQEMPEAAKGLWEGMLQLFYCTNIDTQCDVACESWFAFHDGQQPANTLVRVIKPGAEELDLLGDAPVADSFPAKRILGWTQGADLPNTEELDELEPDVAHDYDDDKQPASGEKLLGWPFWVQGIEYPSCPQCQGRMRLLFQLDSERSLPWMWGDGGLGHITQCPIHPHIVGFGWAC